MRVTGFVLLAIAAIAAIIAFSDLSNYAPNRDLAWNFSNAVAFRRATTEQLPCPIRPTRSNQYTIGSCPTSQPIVPRSFPGTPSVSTYGLTTVHFAGVRLGVVTAASVAIAFVGAGLLIFGKGRKGSD